MTTIISEKILSPTSAIMFKMKEAGKWLGGLSLNHIKNAEMPQYLQRSTYPVLVCNIDVK